MRTRVGYTGGATSHPTYESIGDHSEAIQIDYDPTKIGYEDLLEVFWNNHSPCTSSWGTQYAAAVFYHDDAQKAAAIKTSNELAEAQGRQVYTRIRRASTFTRAEDYHQKYGLRRRADVVRELEAIYPTLRGFVDSTVAARLNGYLGGHRTSREFAAQLPQLGLSKAAGQAFLEDLRRYER